MDYWEESVRTAFDDAGIVATDEQIKSVADDIEVAHENYGMSCGHDHIPNPLQQENDELNRELKREREKEVCNQCKGSGLEIVAGPCHSGESDCYKCRGRGFIYNS